MITRARLRAILRPAPGERMLEIGPGTGCCTLDLARWFEPDEVRILDL